MISCFEAKDKYLIVNWFYKQESEEWHRSIHKRAGTEQENVWDTINTISENSIMYCMQEGNELAAFFVKFEDENGNLCLEGFHIAKKFRMVSFITEFWKLVKEKFRKDFVTGIYSNNEPALRHLKLQGFEINNIVKNKDTDLVILKIKNQTSCRLLEHLL